MQPAAEQATRGPLADNPHQAPAAAPEQADAPARKLTREEKARQREAAAAERERARQRQALIRSGLILRQQAGRCSMPLGSTFLMLSTFARSALHAARGHASAQTFFDASA